MLCSQDNMFEVVHVFKIDEIMLCFKCLYDKAPEYQRRVWLISGNTEVI